MIIPVRVQFWVRSLLLAAFVLFAARSNSLAQQSESANPADMARAEIADLSAVGRPFPNITAVSAIVIDRDTGAVLGGKNPDTLLPNPSTTKMMTALLAIERNGANLDAIVGPISANAAATYGSTMGLEPGDSLSLRDLLYGLMLPSGNDAAVAIAEWMSGSEHAFVPLMNQRAQSLGLTHTSYRNAFGFDPVELPTECVPPYSTMFNCGHYSTARDLATLARLAIKQQPVFARIVQTADWTLTSWLSVTRARRVISLHNDNLLLSSIPYSGANGVKTGMSTSAGFCMVASATRSGHSLLSVVLHTASDQARHAESKQLLDWGFSQSAGTAAAGPLPAVRVSVSPNSVNAGGDAAFVITTSQADPTQPTTVRYAMSGSAGMGTDYSLTGTVGEADIAAGSSSTRVGLHAFNASPQKIAKKAILKLLPGTTYRLVNPKKAQVIISGR